MQKTIRIKTNVKLFPWQRQVVDNLKTHWKGYTHVIKSKRQCGKSVLLEMILIQTALERYGSVSICLSPTLEQSRKMFKEVLRAVKPLEVYNKCNEMSLWIRFYSGSMIYFKSAEQRDGLRGYTVSGIYVIDECAYVDDNIFWETLSFVNVSQSPVILCSTPNHKAGFFYEYFMRGYTNQNNVLSYDWSEFDTSALLPKEKLEEYREALPYSKFKTEFLGEFLDNEGGVFGNYGHIIRTDKSLTFSQNDNTISYYFGIDWGSGQGEDDTAIAVFTNKGDMTDLQHFNDKDETQTVDFIVNMIKKWKPVKIEVETNSIGQVFYGLLKKAIERAGIRVQMIRFTTTNESKERIINNFQVAIQNDTVSIPDSKYLITQMDMYEMKLNKNNKRTYNAHNGYHDDCVMAMLMGYDCINKGQYVVR